MNSLSFVQRSILGQTWQWRGNRADAGDPDFTPDDLVTQLLLARGVARDDLERHRNPTLRGFMPDPSIFRDMDVAAERLADAVQRGEQLTVYGDYDVDGATSAALLIRLFRAGHWKQAIISPTAARRLWPVRRSAGSAGRRWEQTCRHRRLRRNGL
jgi:hypothetical protein